MTLPASGQISMADVNFELQQSSSAQISLNDTNVRTLAGVPSGQIAMSNLHGKTYAAQYRPADVTLDAGTMGSPTTVYGTSGAFQGNTSLLSGTLKIDFAWDLYADGSANYSASAAAGIQYSTNSGSSWLGIGSSTQNAGEGNPYVSGSGQFTVALTNIYLSQLRVRIYTTVVDAPYDYQSDEGPYDAEGSCWTTDIYFQT